jgi:hypothetical protein
MRMTHFQALYGRLPPTIPSYNKGLSLVHEVNQNYITEMNYSNNSRPTLHAQLIGWNN